MQAWHAGLASCEPPLARQPPVPPTLLWRPFPSTPQAADGAGPGRRQGAEGCSGRRRGAEAQHRCAGGRGACGLWQAGALQLWLELCPLIPWRPGAAHSNAEPQAAAKRQPSIAHPSLTPAPCPPCTPPSSGGPGGRGGQAAGGGPGSAAAVRYQRSRGAGRGRGARRRPAAAGRQRRSGSSRGPSGGCRDAGGRRGLSLSSPKLFPSCKMHCVLRCCLVSVRGTRTVAGGEGALGLRAQGRRPVSDAWMQAGQHGLIGFPLFHATAPCVAASS